jgi:hypothetical protein
VIGHFFVLVFIDHQARSVISGYIHESYRSKAISKARRSCRCNPSTSSSRTDATPGVQTAAPAPGKKEREQITAPDAPDAK